MASHRKHCLNKALFVDQRADTRTWDMCPYGIGSEAADRYGAWTGVSAADGFRGGCERHPEAAIFNGKWIYLFTFYAFTASDWFRLLDQATFVIVIFSLLPVWKAGNVVPFATTSRRCLSLMRTNERARDEPINAQTRYASRNSSRKLFFGWWYWLRGFD